MKTCSIEGCSGKHEARGLCSKHYQRWLASDASARPKCLISGCQKSQSCKGYCVVHYGRLQRHGDPEYLVPRPPIRICEVEGCGRRCHAKGFCDKHYQAFLEHGDPNGGRPQLPPRQDGLKRCSTCKIPKNPAEFNKCAATKDGLHCNCKPCSYEISKDWYGENRERALNTKRVWVQDNREKVRGYDKKAYWKDPVKTRETKRKAHQKNPQIKRKSKLLSRFGITLEDYDRMLADQKGVCAICHQTESKPGKNLCVDHCHSTGVIRGLLCSNCNLALGHIKESITSALSLIEYLKKYSPS